MMDSVNATGHDRPSAAAMPDKVTGPYLDKSGEDVLEGGGTLLVQGGGRTFAATGHSDVLVSGDKIYRLYHGYRLPSGGAELRIVEQPFDDEGWPVAAAGP
jgi:arabinan endo-1,5-alpha-L-arabinosidase